MVQDYQDPEGSDPISLQFEEKKITMILWHGNESDVFFMVYEGMQKRKRDLKKNFILEVNLKQSMKEPQELGYFVGTLQTIYRQKKSRYIYGFITDADMRSTNLYRLDIVDEKHLIALDLFKPQVKQAQDMKIKLQGAVLNSGLARIVEKDQIMRVLTSLSQEQHFLTKINLVSMKKDFSQQESCILIVYIPKKRTFIKGYDDGLVDSESDRLSAIRPILSFYPFNSTKTQDKLAYIAADKTYTAIASDKRRVKVYLNDKMLKGDTTVHACFHDHEGNIT